MSSPTLPTDGRRLHSEVTRGGEVRLSIAWVPVDEPGPGEVVVRVRAAPLNPSDLGLMLARADLGTVRVTGDGDDAVLSATVPAPALAAMTARLDQPLPVGNEGAGEVVAVGEGAEHLLGRTVAVLGGAMYADYRTVPARSCLPLPEGTPAAAGAAAFVNPLTALSMVETLRREGHTALVHTAASSNLGQMLVRICRADGIGLVNVVRRPEQVTLLRDLGAEHVVDSSADGFVDDLAAAVAATGATLGFDALGGGPLAGQVLAAMEKAAAAAMTTYSPYGSTAAKQVYVYGGLDPRPLEVDRGIGLTWGLGGWLLGPFLGRIGPEAMAAMVQRVGAELTTTFASEFTAELTLADVLRPDRLAAYATPRTGEKYLITP